MTDDSTPKYRPLFVQGAREPRIYTLHDFGAVWRRRAALMLWTFLLSVFCGLLVVFLMPPVYEAVAEIELRRESRTPAYQIKSSQPENFTMVRNLERKEELNTEAEVLKSRPIIESVVVAHHYTIEKMDRIHDFRKYVRFAYNWVKDTAVWLYDEAKYRTGLARRPTPEEARLLAFERLIGSAAGRLRIEALADSDILRVSFRSSDPRLAQEAVNAIAEEYLRHQAETRQSNAQNFFLEQAGRMADDLHRQEAELEKLKQKFATYSVDEQRRLLLGSLTQTSNALKIAGTALDKATARRAALQTQIKAQPAMITARRETVRNPAVDEINKRLIDLDLKRNNIAQNFQAGSSVMAGIEREIAAARHAKRELETSVQSTVVDANNPIHQSIEEDLVKTEAEIGALTAEAASLRGHLASFRVELDLLNRNELELKDRERRVKMQEEAYLLYAKNREQARVSEDLASARLSEIRIVDRASLPIHTVRPKKWLYSGIAFGIAVLLAAFAAFLAEYNDLSFSSESQVPALLGLPVLASLPVLSPKEMIGDPRMLETRR